MAEREDELPEEDGEGVTDTAARKRGLIWEEERKGTLGMSRLNGTGELLRLN